MTGICLKDDPLVVLTHWHYDHFHAANEFTTAPNRTWIAPFQKIGPCPQSAMANSIIQNGTLMIWNGKGVVRNGAIELERCTGSTGNFNRSGIAVWVNGPDKSDAPILLPGDAGYADIPSLAGSVTRSITSLTVSHHGGQAAGPSPSKQNLPAVADNILVIGPSSGGGGGDTVDPATVASTGDIKAAYSALAIRYDWRNNSVMFVHNLKEHCPVLRSGVDHG